MATAGHDEDEKKRGGEESRLEEILTTLRCNQNSIEVLGLVWFGLFWFGLVWFGLIFFRKNGDSWA